MIRIAWLVIACALLAACGSSATPAAERLADPTALQGKTIAIVSVTDPAAIEARYVLQERYGLEVSLAGAGDITFTESPQESISSLVADGTVGAAVATGAGSFDLSNDEGLRIASHVAEEMHEMTGPPVLSSVMATYRDVATEKADALREANRMLAGSVSYFRTNHERVITTVAREQSADIELLRWWRQHTGLLFGDESTDMQEQLLWFWEAARSVGDIDAYPKIATVLFAAGDTNGQSARTGDRQTISVAVEDDALHHAALYAIEHTLVTSDSVDLSVTYLPSSVLADAVFAREFDIVEADPLAVTRRTGVAAGLIVLSGGVQDLDTTLLFVSRTGGSAP